MVLMGTDSWQNYGFPNISFRTAYLPWVGLVKALNERLDAATGTAHGGRMPVPGYFTPRSFEMIHYCDYFDNSFLQYAVMGGRKFVNPDKIPSATSASDCYWTFSDLLLAAAGKSEGDVVTPYDAKDMLMPDIPVKWASQRYNAINLLRYAFCNFLDEWPYVEYEDINDTYNFKAP